MTIASFKGLGGALILAAVSAPPLTFIGLLVNALCLAFAQA
jgi:hypothetical protein